MFAGALEAGLGDWEKQSARWASGVLSLATPTQAGRCPLLRDGLLPLLGAVGIGVHSVQSSVI